MQSSLDPQQSVSAGEKIRCVIAHDHVLLRQALRRLLEDEPDIEVVSEAENAAECLRKAFELRPEVVVADAKTMGLTAHEVGLCVARESPGTKVVMLNVGPPAGNVETAAEGGTACDVRESSAEQLAEMVRGSCARGGTQEYAASELQMARETAPAGRALTTREREVVKLLAEGKTVRSAATMLGVSSKTVDSHKFNLMRKLNLHNKAELVMWAVQAKVVKVPAGF